MMGHPTDMVSRCRSKTYKGFGFGPSILRFFIVSPCPGLTYGIFAVVASFFGHAHSQNLQQSNDPKLLPRIIAAD
jgi:hypothetical protein